MMGEQVNEEENTEKFHLEPDLMYGHSFELNEMQMSFTDTQKTTCSKLPDQLTVEYLIDILGHDDVLNTTTLTFTVDSNKQSIDSLGELLPQLKELRLTFSVLNSFRDLGTSLRHLQILWASRCGLTTLDGVGSLVSLREIYLSFNNIVDCSPLNTCDELQVLDLEGNSIDDIGQIMQLGSCQGLDSLTLEGNPITIIPYYRRIVHKYISQLEILDDESIKDDDILEVTEGMLDEAILKLKEPRVEYDDYFLLTNKIKHCATEDKVVQSVLSKDSVFRFEVSGSDLTHGSGVIFAGNVSHALRRRKSQVTSNRTLQIINDST